MSLENDFDHAMHGTYEAARKKGYVATYFLKMLHEHGGVETAKRLLEKPDAQIGLTKLWELDLLEETVEAVLWNNTQYHPLFNSSHIQEAHRRLDEFGYFNKKK